MTGMYDCEKDGSNTQHTGNTGSTGNLGTGNTTSNTPQGESGFGTGIAVGIGGVLVAAGLLGAGIMVGRRGRSR
jgi:hypothetical protein